jgi:hypothetical protein
MEDCPHFIQRHPHPRSLAFTHLAAARDESASMSRQSIPARTGSANTASRVARCLLLKLI